ncbi:LuxE/PaaK family acyltransferase [Inconstantimicrobium porci]|uniref:LuxE/PaaK family acyltransferase n=1 Tax=Inconstantimicrobium porci TaxID=2652291 RepID=UPI00240914B4|nr:hypothetical protein [Inconstantimicrobium porci]MDD6771970.1 hypothetical protein [Inconstantimicrobium porci]
MTKTNLSEEEMRIYKDSRYFFPSKEMRETIGQELIYKSFVFQYHNNAEYKRYCDNQGINPNVVEADIRKIPLIPSTLFKKHKIRTNTNTPTVRNCYSSGTQGSVSTIERDEDSLTTFFTAMGAVAYQWYNVKDYVVLNLGPSVEEAQEIWFAYVMSSLNKLVPTYNYVKNSVFLCSDLCNDLKRYSESKTKVALVGSPIMYMNLFEFMDKNNVDIILEKPILMTGGGWKKNIDKSVPQTEFNKLCMEHIKGLKQEAIRDIFNMVELNTCIVECEHKHKHVPVWMDVYAIDMDTYKPAEDGKEGLLAFVDSSAKSYPDYIMSGDLGRVTYVDNCPCGRKGKCIEITRRIDTIEARGCALKIQKSVNDIK